MPYWLCGRCHHEFEAVEKCPCDWCGFVNPLMLEEKTALEESIELLLEDKKTEKGVDVMDATPFIRGIQLAEGNPDCFRRAVGGCDQLKCAWRKYCLEDNKPPDDFLAILYEWMLTEK